MALGMPKWERTLDGLFDNDPCRTPLLLPLLEADLLLLPDLIVFDVELALLLELPLDPDRTDEALPAGLLMLRVIE